MPVQRFKGNIETDLVSIFEEVGEGLSHGVNPHDLPFDRMSLDTFSECRSAEAHNLQGRVVKRGAPGPPIYSNPHPVR